MLRTYDLPNCCCSYVAGVIPVKRLQGFMRLLYFACHGNVYVRHVVIPEMQDTIGGDVSLVRIPLLSFRHQTL